MPRNYFKIVLFAVVFGLLIVSGGYYWLTTFPEQSTEDNGSESVHEPGSEVDEEEERSDSTSDDNDEEESDLDLDVEATEDGFNIRNTGDEPVDLSEVEFIDSEDEVYSPQKSISPGEESFFSVPAGKYKFKYKEFYNIFVVGNNEEGEENTLDLDVEATEDGFNIRNTGDEPVDLSEVEFIDSEDEVYSPQRSISPGEESFFSVPAGKYKFKYKEFYNIFVVGNNEDEE